MSKSITKSRRRKIFEKDLPVSWSRGAHKKLKVERSLKRRNKYYESNLE